VIDAADITATEECDCSTCRVVEPGAARRALLNKSFSARATHNAHVVTTEVTSLRAAVRAGRDHYSPISPAHSAGAAIGIERMKRLWQDEIRRLWGIRHVTVESLAPHGHYLWTSRCARTKEVPEGKPQDLYRSDLLEEFYDFVELNRLRYGIVSDRYGLHMDGEILGYYDVHPSTLSNSDKCNLGATVARKAVDAGCSSVVFFAHSPLMSRPYFEILSHSRLEVFYVTTLRSQGR
jgi:hypothetical protein